MTLSHQRARGSASINWCFALELHARGVASTANAVDVESASEVSVSMGVDQLSRR